MSGADVVNSDGRYPPAADDAPLVVFDFDHTLYDGDSGGHLFAWLIKRSWWRTLLALLIAPVFAPMIAFLPTRRVGIGAFVWVGTIGFHRRHDLAAQPRGIPIPPRYRDRALSLGRDLVSDPMSVGRIIHGDLHYENVLATPQDLLPDRGEWLAIDPKPMSGDPHYELAPMLWNRYDELAGDVRGGIRRRFQTLVELAGLDEDRARVWVVVRMILTANWSVQDAQRAGRDLSAQELAWLTRCIAITKSVQE